MPNSAQTPTRPRRLLARERQKLALELRLQGQTFNAIGAELGVSWQAARKAVVRSLEETKSAIAERADELRTVEAERLEAITRVLWPRVLEGDLRAIDRVLRTRESFRRLTGLDLSPEPPGAHSGDTYLISAGGDVNLAPKDARVVDVRKPWERPEWVEHEPPLLEAGGGS